jgi:hypothetical protein
MNSNTLAHKAMLAGLNISIWGARVFDRAAAAEILDKHKAAHNRGRFTKRLISRDNLAKFFKIEHEARSFFYTHTQPWLNDGARILPSALFTKFANFMREKRQEFEAAVAEFEAEYPGLMLASKLALGDLFDAEEYPAPDQIKHRFGFSFEFRPFPSVDDFRVQLDEADMASIKSDLKESLDRQAKEAGRDTAQRIAEVVGKLAEKLKAYKPGDKKAKIKAEGVFHDSLIQHVRDLAALIPAFNMTNDPGLDSLHKEILKKLCTFDAEDLRESDNIRGSVAKNADAILKKVGAYLA